MSVPNPDFGDATEDDSIDTADLDLDAVGRIFVLLLRRLRDEGEVGEVLILLAFARLYARLKRERTA